MFTTDQLNLIKQSLSTNRKKVEDKPELAKKIDAILTIIDNSSEYKVAPNISPEEFTTVDRLIVDIEGKIKQYTGFVDGGDLDTLETLKRELTGSIAYLTNFRDRFIYEIEFLEDVFKKEKTTQFTIEVAKVEGISFTQAEKKVHADPRLIQIRRDLHQMKQRIGVFKTKYDFYNKVVQSIIQSISVVGKEKHNSRMSQ